MKLVALMTVLAFLVCGNGMASAALESDQLKPQLTTPQRVTPKAAKDGCLQTITVQRFAFNKKSGLRRIGGYTIWQVCAD